jgi:hypothetical protein
LSGWGDTTTTTRCCCRRCCKVQKKEQGHQIRRKKGRRKKGEWTDGAGLLAALLLGDVFFIGLISVKQLRVELIDKSGNAFAIFREESIP